MSQQHEPIKIEAGLNGQVIPTQFLYYKDSFILTQLRYYPLVQWVVIILFVFVIPHI